MAAASPQSAATMNDPNPRGLEGAPDPGQLPAAERVALMERVAAYLEEEIAQDNDRNTALHMAAARDDSPAVRYLLGRVRLNPRRRNAAGWTALHSAASSGNLGPLRCLIDAGFEVNAAANNGDRPIHCAALRGHLVVVEHLVGQAQATAGVMTDNGYTPLHSASYGGHLATVEYLLGEAGVDVAAHNERPGYAAAHVAAMRGHLEILQRLLRGVDPLHLPESFWDETPLHMAALNGHIYIVRWLIQDFQVPANSADENGGTALHRAAQAGHVLVVRWLVEVGGARVDAAYHWGDTALHVAVRNGHLDVAIFLVDGANADRRATNNAGDKPFDVAERARRESTEPEQQARFAEIVAWLRQRGG